LPWQLPEARPWAGWPLIEHHFLVDKYSDATMLPLPWGIASGINVIDYVIAIALQAAREFKFLAQMSLMSAPITAGATAVLILWHGYTWTIYGVALGSAVFFFIATARLQRVRRRMMAPIAAAAGGG
jgi:hypothetical protein